MKKQKQQSLEVIKQPSTVQNHQKQPLLKAQSSPSKNANPNSDNKQKGGKPIDKSIEKNDNKNMKLSNSQNSAKNDHHKVSNQAKTNKVSQVLKKQPQQISNPQTNKVTANKVPEKQKEKLDKSLKQLKSTPQKDQSPAKLQLIDKSPQKSKAQSNVKPKQSLDKSTDLTQSKLKDNKEKGTNQTVKTQKQEIKKSVPNLSIPQNSQKNKLQQNNQVKDEPKKYKQVNNPKGQASKLNKSTSVVQQSIPTASNDPKQKVVNPKDQQKNQNKGKQVEVQTKTKSPSKKQTKNQNPSKSVIIQSPSKNAEKNNKNQLKVSQSPAKLQTKQSPQKGNTKQSPSKDPKQVKNQSLPKSPNKDSKNANLKQNQSQSKAQLNKKPQENLLKGSGSNIKINGKTSNDNQSLEKNAKNQSLKKDPKAKGNTSILQRMIQSAPQSPRIVESKYSPEDIARLKFLKRLQKQKKSIQQRLQRQRQLEEMEQERIRQEKQRQQQRKQSQQKTNKLRSIESRLEQIEKRKKQRKRQISERNRQYLQKKTQFTLEHKIINQWLQKQMEENKIKEKQLQVKISKMKPMNHLQAIKDHMQLIESYRQMHNSRFKQEDLKFERSKSRIELEKMYKSNWYKQIQQNDPTETFKLEQEKKKEEKQLLLMKIDNMKKYAEYVKANHKPDNTQQSVFKYQKSIIKHFTAEQIKRMGMDNLSYCKEIVEKNPKRKSKASLSQHNEFPKYEDYLQKLKTERKRKQNLGMQEDFDQLVQNIKNSTTLTKQQKIKRITHLAEKMEKKAQQKQEIFNRTNTSRLKIMQNKIKDSKLRKKQSSLPLLKYRSASQPKLKKTDSHKTLLKNKTKGKNEDYLKEIEEKLMLLKKI